MTSSAIATATTTAVSATSTSSTTSQCSCPVCKRHESPGQPGLHEDLRSCWHELKSAILRIYRESGLVLNQTFMQQNRLELNLHIKGALPSNDRLKEIVHKLCVHDRHKLYQCLEAQVRLFVVEMRLNLLKHLEQGSQALFEAMIDQYGKLCRASKKSAQFLQELETKHLRKFNLTWEFLNRRLFQSTVYSDTFIKHGLPKLTALTKDRSLIDMYARFLKFEDEMTVISVVWREAQQFIDKYEKFAILNKKRALIKEWEQFSVEWVLDDHVANGGKGKPRSDSGGSGDSPMCIKKPSIECLNARFLEEQKLLKSGKNMQSVNIEVETHSALQEQTLLAAYGEWDAIDIKTITNLPPPNKHLKSSTASTQVDLLLTSKAKSDSPKVVEQNDDDECDEEEECDDEEEDVDDEEEEEEDDDSCSDQSSTTSTSTSNNPRGEGGRVCDCCYCEVFGHGMPAVAPTSRNYNEMRERLRLRLSKRKAEKCEKSGPQNAIAIENSCKSKDQIEKHDERDLEELINFINGTDANGATKKKKEKPKKKKEKEKEKKTNEKENPKNGSAKAEKENKQTNNSNSKTAETKTNHKLEHKPSDHPKDVTSVVNNNNSHNNNNNNSTSSTNGKSNANSSHCHQNVTTKLKEQQTANQKTSDRSVQDTSIAKPVTESKPMVVDLSGQTANSHHNNSINGVSNVSNGNVSKNSKNNGNNKKKQKTTNDKKEDNHLTHNSVQIQNNHNHSKANNNSNAQTVVCNGVIPTHKQNGTVGTVVANGTKQSQQQNNNNSLSPERPDIELRHNIKQKQNRINRNKKKGHSDEALSPDDVFMPKDIDLDNGELDEFEKELEAFKRFCFNSVPLKVKEKVNLNLKDIVIKKKE